MHYAAALGNSALLFKLLVNNANKELFTKGAYQKRPLHLAAEAGELLAVQYLIRMKANVNSYSKHGDAATNAQGITAFGLIGEVRFFPTAGTKDSPPLGF